MVSARAFIFHMCSPCGKNLFGTKGKVICQGQSQIPRPLFFRKKKSNIGHYFWMVSDKAFIFYMYIHCGLTVSLLYHTFRIEVKIRLIEVGKRCKACMRVAVKQ